MFIVKTTAIILGVSEFRVFAQAYRWYTGTNNIMRIREAFFTYIEDENEVPDWVRLFCHATTEGIDETPKEREERQKALRTLVEA